MPKSRTRKKKKNSNYTPRPNTAAQELDNPAWWVPTMLTLLVVGLVWVVWTYLTKSAGPIPKIGSWNLGIGFAVMITGFVMTMRWK